MKRIIYLGLMVLIIHIGGVYVAQQNILDDKINDLAHQLTRRFLSGQKITIAIVGFNDGDGKLRKLSELLRTELPSPLLNSPNFTIVGRDIIDKIVDEQKLALSGLFDQASAKKIGQLLGADALITGTVYELGSDQPVRIKALCYSVKTGELLSDATVNIPRYENLREVLGGNSNNSPRDGGNLQTPRDDEKNVAGSFVAKMLKCWRDSNIVVCNMRLTNKGRTNPIGRVRFSGGLVMDESSNKALLKRVFNSGKAGNTFEIISGGSMDVELQFQGVSMDSKIAKIVQIVINGEAISYSNICLTGYCGRVH